MRIKVKESLPSVMKTKTSLFLLHSARFALFCFAKVGCASVMKTKTSLFVLHYARFALLLQNGSRTPACRWHP